MGIPLKFLNPANYRQMVMITRLSSSLSNHMNKKCRYCDLDLGTGDEYPVVDFVEHLARKHLDKIETKDIESYRKLLEKALK